MELLPELLFFDTFSHEANEDINLDLVQFPKPVYITEVRIIPLGARVQADFPGGVRLGATNPSKFGIEFFVNDLGKPGASTFEILGNLEYNQNNCIHLECPEDKILTDGLVLRGWYSTITLAVYGTLTKNLTEQIASPQHTPSEPTQEIIDDPIADAVIPPTAVPVEPIPIELQEPSFEEPVICVEPREPREPNRVFSGSANEDSFFDSPNRELGLNSSNRSEHEKRSRTYSDSNDREYNSSNTSKKRDWSRSPEYRHSRRRSERSRRDSDTRGSSSDHRRPRTPPQIIDSPPSIHRLQSPDDNCEEGEEMFDRQKTRAKSRDKISPESQKTLTEPNLEDSVEVRSVDGDEISEQFEPILSDDEILGDDSSPVQDEDIDIDESEFDNPIKVFDPFKMPINVHNSNLKEICGSKILSIQKAIDKFKHLERLDQKEFLRLSVDEKETFVNLCELLINNLIQINHLSLMQRNFIVDNAFTDESIYKLITKVLSVALNFECACSQTQPGYKIRHIKIGPRLVELIFFSPVILKYAVEKEHLDPFKYLFDLYHQDHMAVSIKLIILRAMYSVLDSKFGVQIFLSNKANGYQQLLLIMQNNPLTRLKFAIKAVIKKINLYEALETIQDIVTKNFTLTNHLGNGVEDFQTLEICILEVRHALSEDALSFQQPKRFLPSNRFEFHKDSTAVRSWSYMIQSYFKMHALAESLLVILTNQSFVPINVLTITLDLLSQMAKCQVGIDYLVDDCFETTELVIKCLLGLEDGYSNVDEIAQSEKLDEEVDSSSKKLPENEEKPEAMEVDDVVEKCDEEKLGDSLESKPVDPIETIKDKTPELVLPVRLTPIQKLGVELAFKIQTRYHIDAITSNPMNVDVLCEHLHALYSQTCSHYGRVHTTEVLGFSGNNLIPFLTLIEKERKIQAKRQLDSPGAKYKSPVLSYSVDLLDVFVRNCTNLDYLVDHGQILLDFVKNHDVFEPSVSAVLQEMAVYLKPLELIDNFSYGGDISALSDLVKRSMEYITTFPGDLIMVLRILKHLIIGNPRDALSETKELKLKNVLLQFYSADGVVTFLNILEKLNNYFEQPGLHAPTLITIQGLQTCQVLLPVVQILRQMLTFVIECRDTSFKDVTAIEHLMKTYFLMHYFPERSQAYEDAQNVRSEIIKILLAYTQPNEDEHIRGSLWTQMIREVIKCIKCGPSTFIPGLQVLAELLPLPLPLSVLKPMTDEETQSLNVNRKLWSAHLHPESPSLAELIQTLCPTTFPQLLDLLTRVCVQLADLAPNMTLLVSKTICDMIVTEFTLNCPNGIGSVLVARLLSFLAQLTCYAAVKISALSILPGKICETFLAILNKSDKQDSHLNCQSAIHRIFENFFDSEICVVNATHIGQCGNLEINLANALPTKELIPDIANAVMTSLLNSEGQSSITALRNMIILTEHDITFYYLRNTLIGKKSEFNQWISKFIRSFENSTDKMTSAITFVLFLRNLIIIDEPPVELTVPNRTLKLNFAELKNLIVPQDMAAEENPLNKLKSIFECKNLEEDINEFENVIQDLKDLIEKLEDSNQSDGGEELSTPIEPNLHHAEGIVTQFLSRQVYTVCENIDDVQLNSSYWLEPLRLDEIAEVPDTDRVQCNLSELISTYLPSDTNLSFDCKRILHLSASPQSNRERTATAPCFRTRRVEVEPQTGRPEKKKIYISPMRARGFQRAPPSRGDLFRSRPPNTSRPPSLHVDDFLALETCGAQPTGPTGYNKLSRDIIGIRGVRGGRSRSRIGMSPYRKVGSFPRGNYTNVVVAPPPPQHFRTATLEPVVSPHFSSEQHSHFGSVPIRSRGRGRIRTFLR